jgi:RNA polymerase sigma factor (sigma-70 family)
MREWGIVSARDQEIEAFLEKHGDFLLHFATNLTSNPNSSQDLIQESLIRFYPKWRFVQAENRLAYFKQILVRENISTWRRRRWREVDEVDEDIHSADDFENTIVLSELLRSELRKLPENHRTAIVLRYVYDHSLNDVAQMMRMPVNTVKSHCARGLSMLKTNSDLFKEFGE